MQPLVLAEQTRQGVAYFLATTFRATTPGFTDLMARFLAEPGSLVKGPYVTIGLPFRKQPGGVKPFDWLSESFAPHAHQARAFARLAGDSPASTIVATGTGSGKTECFLQGQTPLKGAIKQ
jgi:DEAD/DEAH box helicase domain-containing protein